MTRKLIKLEWSVFSNRPRPLLRPTLPAGGCCGFLKYALRLQRNPTTDDSVERMN